jgi:hypothetical protein
MAAPELLASPRRLWDPAELEEDSTRILERWEIQAQRGSDSLQRAARQALELSHPVASGAPPASPWTEVGLGIHRTGDENLAGRVREAQFVYADDVGATVLYVASPGGGLFRLVGVWQSVAHTLPAEPMVASFVVDREDSKRILLATGDISRRRGTGVWRSLDGGLTWQNTGPSPGPSISFRILQDSTDPDVVLLAGADGVDPGTGATHGIWRSDDFGSSWTKIHTGVVTDLRQDPAFPEFWLAVESGVGVLESSDSGLTFHTIGGHGGVGLGGTQIRRSAYTISESSPHYHYLLASDATGALHGIFRSTDYGLNWTRIDHGDKISWQTGSYTTAIGVDPEDRGVLFVGMGGNQWSANADAADPAGICWQYYEDTDCGSGDFHAGHGDQTGFAFLPEELSAGNTEVVITNDGGYFVYDWAIRDLDGFGNTLGLNVAQIWPDYRGNLAHTPADPTLFLAGLYDNGVVRIDLDHPQTVRFVNGGDGGHVDISPDDPSQWSYSYGLGFRRLSSPDGGVTEWGLNCELVTGLAPAIVTGAAPGTADALYTYDEGDLWWKPLSPACDWEMVNDAPIGPQGTLLNALDLANDPTRFVFYLTRAWNPELYVLEGQNLSLTPEIRTPPLPQGVSSWAAAFPDASALQPATVYYTTGERTPGRAFLSTDAGMNWEDVTGNLVNLAPDVQFWELIGDPRDLDTLLLATDAGVFRSDDRGVTWARWMDGLPSVVNAMNIELVHDGADAPFVMIGTYGRGFWRRDLDALDSEQPLFADDFETGDPSRWSDVTP